MKVKNKNKSFGTNLFNLFKHDDFYSLVSLNLQNCSIPSKTKHEKVKIFTSIFNYE